ncbi:MAG: hypothetical protein ACJZ2G_03220 [Thalassobaculaceae bacterium]|jgi:hypothetical protein
MADIYANKNKEIKVATKSSENDANGLSAVRHLGFEYTGDDAAKANQNELEPNQRLIKSLPDEIQLAVSEWALQLKHVPWKLRRRAIKRFSESFADNFLNIMPELSDEECESLALLGLTCLLEELDTGAPVTNQHQAQCYLESFHDYHKSLAEVFFTAQEKDNSSLH